MTVKIQMKNSKFSINTDSQVSNEDNVESFQVIRGKSTNYTPGQNLLKVWHTVSSVMDGQM